MVWKKKEKPLTPEEAIALAKKNFAPFWVGSAPRLAPVRHPDGKVTAHPLDPSFVQGSWILFFLDPTTFAGECAVRIAQEWHRRYAFKELGFLTIVSTPYPHLRAPGSGESLKKQLPSSFPYVMDAEGLLAAAFSIAATPAILILNQGQLRMAFGPSEILGKSEMHLQAMLRETDPGLPLPLVLERIEGGLRDSARFDFTDAKAFPKPGFVKIAGNAEGRESAHFQPKLPEEYPDSGFRISGKWVRDGARIITSDPTASILFRSSGTHVSVIAQSLAKDASVNSQVLVELDGKAAFDSVSGPDLRMTEDGQTVHFPGEPRLSHLLINLPEKNRNVALRFPTSDQAPVALLGIRVGKP